MRKKIVAGNWKMNLLDEEVINYIVDFNSKKNEIESDAEIIILPASIYLDTMISMPDWDIKIGAQTYLNNFYQSFGFHQVGDDYIEDGIPHIHMLINKLSNNE